VNIWRVEGLQDGSGNGNKNRKNRKNTQLTTIKSSKIQTECVTVTCGSVSSLSTNGGLLSGILSELYTSTRFNFHTVNTYVHALNTGIIVNDYDSDEEIKCDINKSALYEEVKDKLVNEAEYKIKKLGRGGVEIYVLGDDWNWDQWQDIGDDDSIPGNGSL